MAQPNSALAPSTPNLQLAWDSTSMGELKLCPRRYQLRILEGWNPRSMSVHLAFGLAYHSALEHYDHAKAAGASYEASVRAAIRQTLRITWDKELKRPWMSEDKYKNRTTLLRTVSWYLDHFREDPLETVILANGKPAVELSFRFSLPYESPLDGPYLLCGHLDRIAKMGGFEYIVDRKTTKHTLDKDYFQQYTPDNQFSTYIFSGKVAFERPITGMIVDAAQVLIEGSRFAREPVTRSQGELEEWIRDLGFWLSNAEFYAKQNYWPMNDKACHVYGGCPFRGICNKTPGVREQYLKASFERRIWDPLQIRGDI